MLLAQLALGYLLARALDEAFDEDPLIFWMIVLGAVLPDLDLLWGLATGTDAPEGTLLLHDPTVWLSCLGLGFLFSSRAMIGLGLGGVLHMAVDTLRAPIAWGIGDLSYSGPLIPAEVLSSSELGPVILTSILVLDLVIIAAATRSAVRHVRRVRE